MLLALLAACTGSSDGNDTTDDREPGGACASITGTPHEGTFSLCSAISSSPIDLVFSGVDGCPNCLANLLMPDGSDGNGTCGEGGYVFIVQDDGWGANFQGDANLDSDGAGGYRGSCDIVTDTLDVGDASVRWTGHLSATVEVFDAGAGTFTGETADVTLSAPM
jgi:hypothetical protein